MKTTGDKISEIINALSTKGRPNDMIDLSTIGYNGNMAQTL
jgi:hypothetical protein